MIFVRSKKKQFPAVFAMAIFLILGVAQQSLAATLLPPRAITVPATDADGSYMVKWTKSPVSPHRV